MMEKNLEMKLFMHWWEAGGGEDGLQVLLCHLLQETLYMYKLTK